MPAGELATARVGHTATLLVDGTVLIAGGLGDDGFLTSAERYDPATASFTSTDRLQVARLGHTATVLGDGQVLMVGGDAANGGRLAAAERYDPATGTFASVGSLSTGRSGHTVTLLPNGTVLVAGGFDSDGNELASAELYDPTTGAFSAVDGLGTARGNHIATLLQDGTVLIAGGLGAGFVALASTEIYTAGPEGAVLSLRAGGQFVFWDLGPATAAEVFGSVKIAWLFDQDSATWTAFVPALGSANFPLGNGVVLWVVSETVQEIVVG